MLIKTIKNYFGELFGKKIPVIYTLFFLEEDSHSGVKKNSILSHTVQLLTYSNMSSSANAESKCLFKQ